MNEHDPLAEVLAQFRTTQPPGAVRDFNRAAVRAALEPVGIAIPWWRRSISLPMPVVLATAAALLISVVAHVLPAGNNAGPSGSGVPVDPPDQGGNSQSVLVATADSQVEYCESQRYLSGIGVIDRNVLYRFGE